MWVTWRKKWTVDDNIWCCCGVRLSCIQITIVVDDNDIIIFLLRPIHHFPLQKLRNVCWFHSRGHLEQRTPVFDDERGLSKITLLSSLYMVNRYVFRMSNCQMDFLIQFSFSVVNSKVVWPLVFFFVPARRPPWSPYVSVLEHSDCQIEKKNLRWKKRRGKKRTTGRQPSQLRYLSCIGDSYYSAPTCNLVTCMVM